MSQEMLTEETKNKWGKLLDECRGVAPITDSKERNVMIRLLENTVNHLSESTPGSSTTQASVDGFDPILINMVRRTQPNLVANQLVGMQPMSRPTGLIFAMTTNTQKDARGKTPGTLNTDTWKNEVDETLTRRGSNEDLGAIDAVDATVAGDTNTFQNSPWPEMGFSIVSQTVTAYSRALKARYTTELAQDLRAIHNLDAESILADMLSTEIVAEKDREIIGLINQKAKKAQTNTAGAGKIVLPAGIIGDGITDGIVDLSAAGFDGRWSSEIYSQLLTVIERMANRIALDTRRGRGNFIICSPNVASALEEGGKLKGSAGTGGSSSMATPDVTGVTDLGILNNRYRVFMDPYASTEYVTVGYKGANVYDAGMFLSDYVPLEFMKAVDSESFQPSMGFKSRYAVSQNPFVAGSALFNADPNGAGRTSGDGANDYYQTATIVGV